MSNVNDLSPLYATADRSTGVATGAITGKRIVKVSATTAGGLASVAHAGAAEAASGNLYAISGTDVAIGGIVPLWHEGIVPVTTGEAITAGQPVTAGAGGLLFHAVAGQVAIGIAMADAGSGADCFVNLDKFGLGAGASEVTGDQANIAAIATADATDLATVITLANATKAKVNTILTMFATSGLTL